MAEPMSDERLAEIQQLAARSRAFVARHLTAALREVLAEVGRQRFEIARANQEIETLGAEVEAEHREAQEAEAEAAQLRQQLQSATVLPERWREVLAERDAARRELAEVRAVHDGCKYKYIGGPVPPGVIEVTPQYEEGEWD